MKTNLFSLNQSEKMRILEMHKTATKKQYLNESNIVSETMKLTENIVITDWLSPDEKYLIFLDELYDLKEGKNYGDIWENPTNLIIFLEHSYKTSNVGKTIKEHANKVLNNILLTEDVVDLTQFKSEIKQFIFEGNSMLDKVWNAGKEWVGDVADKTVKGVKDFANTSWEGIKKFGGAVLRGDWQEIVNLLKKGVLYFARKIRQAVYSEVGLIIDTMLVVSGVGKVAQFVVWAIVVALDIYEFSTGNYEHDDPMWMRVIFFVFDVMGMVIAGAAAKAGRAAAKAALGGVRTTEEAAAIISKSPKLKTSLELGVNSLGGASEKMTAASTKLGSGKIGTWFKGAISKMGSFFGYLGKTLGKLLAPKTLAAGAKTTAVLGGFGVGSKLYQDYMGNKSKGNELSSADIKALTNSGIETDYTEFL